MEHVYVSGNSSIFVKFCNVTELAFDSVNTETMSDSVQLEIFTVFRQNSKRAEFLINYACLIEHRITAEILNFSWI